MCRKEARVGDGHCSWKDFWQQRCVVKFSVFKPPRLAIGKWISKNPQNKQIPPLWLLCPSSFASPTFKPLLSASHNKTGECLVAVHLLCSVDFVQAQYKSFTRCDGDGALCMKTFPTRRHHYPLVRRCAQEISGICLSLKCQGIYF